MSDVLARLMQWAADADADIDADLVLRDAITEIAGLRALLDELRLAADQADVEYRGEIEQLKLAIRRLAEQDATLSVCHGNVTVEVDAGRVVRLPPLDPNGAPGWNAAIGAVREALADAGVDWDTE